MGRFGLRPEGPLLGRDPLESHSGSRRGYRRLAAEQAGATETAGPDRAAQESTVGTRETRSRAEEARLGCSGSDVKRRAQDGSIDIEPS